MENVTILGISVGTWQCGVALIRNGTLVDWKAKSYRGKWSESKLSRIIRSLEKVIDRNGVKKIGCKVALQIKTYKIDSIVAALKEIAKQRDISFYITYIGELKANEHVQISNKEVYAEHLSTLYPELTPMFRRHKKVKTEYYLRVFEAIGAALYCYNEQLVIDNRD